MTQQVDPGARVRHDTRMGRGARTGRNQRRRGGCGCSLILLVLILVGLVAAAEVGLRWYLSDRAEKEVSAQIDAPVDISFGSGLLLWEVFTTRTADQVHLIRGARGEHLPQQEAAAERDVHRCVDLRRYFLLRPIRQVPAKADLGGRDQPHQYQHQQDQRTAAAAPPALVSSRPSSASHAGIVPDPRARVHLLRHGDDRPVAVSVP